MDRLTQLQECLDKLSETFFTSVGVLQRDAPLVPTNTSIPVTSWTADQIQLNTKSNQELAQVSAKQILETSRIIDFLITQLPGITDPESHQLQRLSQLEEENRIAGEDMIKAIQEAEQVLDGIKSSLRFITNEHFQSTSSENTQ